MSLIRPRNTSRAARTRPAGPRCRGGASSLLRLTQPGDRWLPTAVDLGDWMSRAASVLMPVTGPHGHTGQAEDAAHGGARS